MSNPSGDGFTFEWANRAGKTWSLTSNVREGDRRIHDFDVGEDCPYYKEGHHNAELVYDEGGALLGIVGPNGKTFNHVIDFTDPKIYAEK